MVKAVRVGLLACVAIIGCAESRITSSVDVFTAQLQNAGIEIKNTGDKWAYYTVLDAQTAAAALWQPCVDPAHCDSVQPGGTTHTPSAKIPGWGESDAVIVYWWHLIPAGDGTYRPDQIRSYHVRI